MGERPEPPKKRAAVTASLKTEVETKAKDLIETVLKPKHVLTPPTEYQGNYIIDNGPVQLDTVGGAYPSMVELPDGLVYCVYYEEGKGASRPVEEGAGWCSSGQNVFQSCKVKRRLFNGLAYCGPARRS